MKLSFRWYGEGDPISLEYIRQIPNMRSIVSAVYDVKPGEVWPEESLKKMKDAVEANGMLFDIVESVPVHEDIKLGRGDVDHLLEVYCENVRRCAKYGVKCVTYNFMPVFDWTRSRLDQPLPDGSNALVYYKEDVGKMDPTKLQMMVLAGALPPAFSGIIIGSRYQQYVRTGTSTLAFSIFMCVLAAPLWIWITRLVA